MLVTKIQLYQIELKKLTKQKCSTDIPKYDIPRYDAAIYQRKVFLSFDFKQYALYCVSRATIFTWCRVTLQGPEITSIKN